MKGGFYGLTGKQISFGFLALVCTTVLFWAWDKTSLVTFLLQPQGRSLELLQVADNEVVGKLKQQHPNVETSQDPAEISSETRKNETKMKTFSFFKGTDGKIAEKEEKKKQEKTKFDASTEKQAPKSSADEEKGSLGSIRKEVDSKQVSDGKNRSKISEANSGASQNSETAISSAKEDRKSLAANMSSGVCNYAKGKWVEDDGRPLYSGSGCKQWLSGMWACRLTQRTDFTYEKLRWQPKDCLVEEFTGPKFLDRMRNKTLAFVGDSLARQQFQSLMCMATGGEYRPDVIDVGKEYGLVKERGRVRPDGWVYRFSSTNTTILYYWSASLSNIEPLNNSNPQTDFALHLDRPPAFLKKYINKFDILVLNTGHHWNRGKFQGNRWHMHIEGKPISDNIDKAKNFTMHSIVNWVNSQMPKYPKLKVFLRSISPRHFFNGDWNTGGTCDNTALLGEKEVFQDESSDSIAASAVKGTKVKLLDITAISQLRDEGHISRYSIKATPGVQDCLHWCLPGVPDTWNEILFLQL